MKNAIYRLEVEYSIELGGNDKHAWFLFAGAGDAFEGKLKVDDHHSWFLQWKWDFEIKRKPIFVLLPFEPQNMLRLGDTTSNDERNCRKLVFPIRIENIMEQIKSGQLPLTRIGKQSVAFSNSIV